MSRARREWGVARDQRSVESLRQSDVGSVVGGHVIAQLPRTSDQIYMGMTVQLEVNEISDGSLRPAGRDFTGSHEASESLEHFDIHQVRRMELVVVAKEACFDSYADWRLQQKLQHCRRIDNDHADSRSSRMIAAAAVFSVTRFRLWILASISSRVGRVASRSSSARR